MALDDTKDVIATILHHPDLNIYANLYAKAFANELVECISSHKDNIEKIGYTLLRNWVYGKDLEQTILDLTGYPMETLLISCGILPNEEGCFNDLDFLSSIVYKNAEDELVRVDVITDPGTFEVQASDLNTLAEIEASVNRGYIPKLQFGENLLPVFNHKQKQDFGIPVFWYYDVQHAIANPINNDKDSESK